jgi:prephenate dehydratase
VVVKSVLESIAANSGDLRILGSYPIAVL